MSLRLRLTLLYATLTGGILLVFAAAVIFVFNALLLNQIDNSLESAATTIIKGIKVDSLGRVEADLSAVEIDSEIYVQVWGLNGELQTGWRTLEGFAEQPFDGAGLQRDRPQYVEIRSGEQHL